MSNVTRHVGVVRSTGSRVFVVWRSLPDDPEHCLILYRDSLPEVYAHTVTDLALGKGQDSPDLWTVMDKIGYLDGRKMLDVLHGLSYLRKQRTCDIDIHYGAGGKIPLDELNVAIDSQSPQQNVDGSVKDYNPFEKPQAKQAETGTIVEKLLSDASEYKRLHEETLERAYNLEPSLRPAPAASVEVPEAKKNVFYIELPDDISQTKAIEAVKKAIAARKVAK